MSSTLTCLISGVSYQVKAGDAYGNLNAYSALEVRGSLDITIEDYNGTYSFVYGQPVVLSDSNLGTIFQGFVGTDKPIKLGPASFTVEHHLTCFDKQYLVDKRTNYTNYTGWYAGDIIVDFVQNTLAAEGVTVAAALRHETSISDFSAGTLSGTVAASDDADGALTLAPSGSNVTFSETTTADFSAGTLTNVTAANNSLTPTTSSAISLNAVLSLVVDSNYIYMNVWSGSMTVGTNDTLHYEMWIKSDNPELCAGIDLTFNDGSHMYDKTLTDTKGLGSSPDNSIGPASNTWYSRDIRLTGLNGKVISNVTVAIDGVTTPGTYQVYFRNVYLASQSGSPFFSTTATATQLNPATVAQSSGFSSVGAGVTVSVVQAWVASTCTRVSPAHSISAVSLLGSSLISYLATSLVQIYVSYDGGSSYQLCSNNASLPALPPGTNVAGLSILLKEVFAVDSGDPTVSASLADVNVSLVSAPPYSKTDLLKTYFTSSDWTTGSTLSHITANSDGTLTLTAITRDWNDTLITSQTSFFDSGSTQSAASGAYSITTASLGESKSRLDFVGSLQNFTLDIDITIDSTGSQTGVVYRTTFWGTTHNSFAYLVAIDTSQLQIGIGANSNTNSYSPLATAHPSVLPNVTYHLTIIVQGNTHLVYFNHATKPDINLTDSTYTSSGNVGLRIVGGSGSTSSWDNLAIVQNFVGTWTSASISLASVGTYGTSVISWLETNTDITVGAAIIVQASVDGGTTYNLCTNGGVIPGLTKGQNVSSVSVKFKITIGTTLGYQIPSISDFVIRVIGNYGIVTGTRTTAPIGIDYIDRANQANWGTASNGQAWTKTGTGTAAVASNTLTLANTTGDVYERLGSVTGTDMDATVPFKLSASGDVAGMTLRYVDANNHYKIAVSTTGVTISKKISGVTTALSTTSLSLTTNTWYYLRFRVVGMSPVLLYGNVWLQGTLEPTIDSTTYQWNNTNWTLTASD